MLLLGIETSCDETAVSVVKNGVEVLSSCISSSKTQFTTTGGVIPENAARSQIEYILPCIHAAMNNSGCTMNDIDAIAVTKGPGLLVSLLVGLTTAKALASLWKKPIIEVNHTLGHLSSVWLDSPVQPVFPALALSISGGHTELWYRESHTKSKIIGETRDDAVGEAFDKGAALLGLDYPGGPAIAESAESGNCAAYTFPLPLHEDKALDFSFSGLKTALKYAIRDNQSASVPDLAASYEFALCSHLLDKLKNAMEMYPSVRQIHIVGGVSANHRLRCMLKATFPNTTCIFPAKLEYCTDNAAMIASAAYFSTRGH